MSDIRYMNIDDACSYLVEATNNVIHDFDMSVVLSEYKYLRDYGHEMPLTEGTFTGIMDKIEEWTDKVRDWIRDIYDRVIEWIQDKLEEFRRWWLRLGLNKKDADAAKAWISSGRDRSKSDFTSHSSLKVTGFLLISLDDLTDLTNSSNAKKIFDQLIKTDKLDKYRDGILNVDDEINDMIKDDFNRSSTEYITSKNDDKKIDHFPLNSDNTTISYSEVSSKEPTFWISPDVYDLAYNVVFNSKSAIVSPIDKAKRDAIRELDDSIRDLKKNRRDADDRETRSDFDKDIKLLKAKSKIISKLSSTMIKMFKDQFSTSVKVVKVTVSVYKTWKNKKGSIPESVKQIARTQGSLSAQISKLQALDIYKNASTEEKTRYVNYITNQLKT